MGRVEEAGMRAQHWESVEGQGFHLQHLQGRKEFMIAKM